MFWFWLSGDVGFMSNPQIISLQSTSLPEGGAPDWIHLIPAGAEILTADARGPYRLVDPQAVIAASTGKLPIDENHAIDLAAPRGEASPARGYVVELQARADGIWGRVDWTETGRALVADRAYLGISPAVIHDGAKRILAIARASLTNRPNFRGLTSLHMETSMTPAVAKALGLADDATEDQILGAIGTLKQPQTALQSHLGQIGLALGVTEATPEAILAAAQARTTAQPAEITALQSELADVSTRLKALQDTTARDRATAFVDGAISEGRVGVKPMRERYIAMHMADAQGTEELIGAMPAVTAELPSGEIALQAADSGDLVTRARAYQARQKAAGIDLGWTAAVTAVSEGKQ